jgi:hypothetical protein
MQDSAIKAGDTMDQRVEHRKALTDAFCRAQPAPASGRVEFAAGSRRRVLFAANTADRRLACCAVGGAIFGNQFQSRIFVGTSSDA